MNKRSMPVILALVATLVGTITVLGIIVSEKCAPQSYAEYDDLQLSGEQVLSAIKLCGNDVKLVCKYGEDVQTCTGIEDISNTYRIPRSLVKRRVFRSNVVKDLSGNVNSIVFELKERSKDRIIHGVNFSQPYVRNTLKATVYTDVSDLTYDEVGHVYTATGELRGNSDIDLDKLYDIYEILDSETYLLLGYYAKEIGNLK